MDLRLRKRKINLFDLEEKILPGIKYIQDILESNVKYVENTNNKILYSLDLEKLSLIKGRNQKEFFCLTNENVQRTTEYISRFLDCKITEKMNYEHCKEYCFLYQIELYEYSDTILYISNETYRFFGFPEIATNFKSYSKEIKTNYNGIYNIEVPIDYNKIIIGPINLEKKELGSIINDIGKLVAIRPTYKKGYFVFLLEDHEISKCFLDVLGRIKISDFEEFTVRYCYKNCTLVNFYGYSSKFFNFPFVSSRERTKVVFILNFIEDKSNRDEITQFISDKCIDLRIKNVFIPIFDLFPSLDNPRIKGEDKVFIEAYDLETSYCMYSILGGLKFKDRVLLSGFYPEENYNAGELE